MTYKDAEMKAVEYKHIIGKTMLNKMDFLDARKVTSLLVAPTKHIKSVYSMWWANGNDNLKAVTHVYEKKSFETFLISYNPSEDRTIYYLKLSTYLKICCFYTGNSL